MDLPEIKQQIIQLLGNKSRRQLRAVNTDWFKLVRYDQFHIYSATPTLLPIIVERLSQYKWPICLSLLQSIKLTPTHIDDQLYKLTQLTSFGCHPIKPDATKENSPNWRRLTILTNLQRLGLQQTPIPVDLVSYYTNLTSLDLYRSTKDIAEVIFNRCTKLEYLQLSLDTEPPRLDPLHRLTFLFVNSLDELDVRALTNLRYLNTIFTSGVNIGNLTTLETLSGDGEIVGDISGNKNLTELTLDLQQNARHVTVLNSLKSLRSLNLTLQSNIDTNVNVNNNDALLMIPQSLTCLTVNIAGDFNIKNMSHLTNLIIMELNSRDGVQCEVTAEDFKPFKHLTALYAGEHFKAIKYLPELRHFFTEDFPELADGSTIDDFDPTCIPKLEWLSISKMTPPPVFSRFTALRSLKKLSMYEQADETYDYDVLTYMELEYLMIKPKKLTRADWPALQKLTKLKELRLLTKEVTLTDDMTLLTRLTQLRNLTVENAKLEHVLPLTFLGQLTCRPPLDISRQLLDENFPYLYMHNFNVTE